MFRWLFALLLSSHLAAAIAATPGEVAEGHVLREITMDGLTGESKALSSFFGRPLIINVWASYCPPCLAEMASLERLSHRFHDELTVIGVSIDDHRDRALRFLDQADTGFPHFIDHQLGVENMLGANRIPLTVLVDGSGRILHKVYGAREWDSPEALQAIRRAFGFERR
ncbi:MAG: TlpA family protein disulfide reductase [Zoogloeaceae bacterium]|nr:TlpA family protein disulfide reductase [Rhodocyclaceae bacterium]MCP5237327.1 TlpA family protein disulfide reductase [Zoogloeaceae bacterium]